MRATYDVASGIVSDRDEVDRRRSACDDILARGALIEEVIVEFVALDGVRREGYRAGGATASIVPEREESLDG